MHSLSSVYLPVCEASWLYVRVLTVDVVYCTDRFCATSWVHTSPEFWLFINEDL